MFNIHLNWKLPGSFLGENLLNALPAHRVAIFVRRSTGITNKKLQEFIIDFKEVEEFKDAISGDVLFSCLGTTLKQAGSKEAQYEVDFTYQYQFAKFASENGVPEYILVSSTSADPNSIFFYSRIKGELEEAVKKLEFKRIVIMQPSVLAGDREKERAGEKWGAALINTAGKILPFLKKYRSIQGSTVASAMIALAKKDNDEQVTVYKLDEIHAIGGK
jgi:uncharacterized protein YbjT (DUF2867 family)